MPVLKGSKQFYNYSIGDILAYNLKQRYEYGLLEKGAYTVVDRSSHPTSGILRQTHDPNYTDGQVYEGLGPSWVWQTGVSVPNGFTQPFQVSGVYVDGSFKPQSGVGTYSHKIDYKNGRVIFDSALDGSPTVKADYVFNDIAVYLTDEPQWRTVIQEYTQQFSQLDTLQPSGLASNLKSRRVWLPALFIENQDNTGMEGLQLGGGEIQEKSIFFHVFSEEPFARNRLIDLINDQAHTSMMIFDPNSAPFPFDFDGTLNSGAIEYPSLAKQDGAHFFTYARMNAPNGGSVQNAIELFRGEMRSTFSIDRYLSTF